MLLNLSIKNFAVLKQLELDFNQGLTVISGSSGAGKSMIIETIKYLYGKRASTDDIRYDTDRSIIEGVFDLPQTARLDALFRRHDIPSDELMIVRREILPSSKSMIKINSKVVTLTALRDIMNEVMIIHSQGSHLTMLDNKRQRYYLDKFIALDTLDNYVKYVENYESFKQVHNKLIDLEQKNKRRIEQIDIYKSYLSEIEALNLEVNSEESLEEELHYLNNFEKISTSLEVIKEKFSQETSPNTMLFDIQEKLMDLVPFDQDYEAFFKTIEAAYYTLNDLEIKVSDSLNSMDFDRERLNEIQQQLQEINRLKRMHNKTFEELIEYRDELRDDIYSLENITESMSVLVKEKDRLYNETETYGEKLHTYRLEHKHQLEEKVIEILKTLDITHARFEIDVVRGKFSSSGISQIVFNFSPNLGEPLKPLNDVASGGELSRVMLAFQTIFSQYNDHSLLILDEIDSGVSGVVASKMATRMKQISEHTQTIVISHLAQTVASADYHLFVDKIVEDNRTVSVAKYLEHDNHVEEIARILSGNNITDEARKNALSLIEKF